MTNQVVQVREGFELSGKLCTGQGKKKMAGKFMTVDGPVTQTCSLLLGNIAASETEPLPILPGACPV